MVATRTITKLADLDDITDGSRVDPIAATAGIRTLGVGAQQAAPGNDSRFSSGAASYRLVSDGTTVTAYDKTGAQMSSGNDGGAVLTAILPAAGSAGATIDFRNDGNVFPWGSVPALPKGITNKLLIRGNGSRVQLSAGGPRFLDLAKVADHDTFQNIEVTDFVVDANNIDGNTHTVIGSKVSGTPTRINFSNIAVRRIRAFNIPATATGRSGVNFTVTQPAGGEGTQNYIKDILLEDVWIDGAVTGFGFGGGTTSVTNYNMLYDNIRVIRCKHTQSSGVAPAINGANIQVGQNVPGNYVLVRDFYGEYSRDIGIEIDNATTADIEDVVIANAKHAFYAVNFCAPAYASAQTINYRRCTALITDAAVATSADGWRLDPLNAIAFGTLNLEGCKFFQNVNVLPTTPFIIDTAVTVAKINFADFEVAVEGWSWNSGSNVNVNTILLKNVAGNPTVTINDLKVFYRGTNISTGLINWSGVQVTGGALQLYVDGYDVDYQITNYAGGPGFVTAAHFGTGGGVATLGGAIRRLRVIAMTDDTVARAIRFRATVSVAITPAPFEIEGCDFSAMATANEILVDATQSAIGSVVTRGNRWKTKPAPVGLTGLVTATGKLLGAAGVLWPCLVQLIQGSGAAITAVDYSTNGGTTYTNLLTQASAALPAGAGPNVGPLMPADSIKATFTTTQPTITLVPVDP